MTHQRYTKPIPSRRIAAVTAPALGMRTFPSRSITTVPYIPGSCATVAVDVVNGGHLRSGGGCDPIAAFGVVSDDLDRRRGELRVVQARVGAVALQELIVRALLDDLTVFHHEDRVRVAD